MKLTEYEQQFQSILEGYLPNGDRLGKRTLAGIEHRPGMDLTFSSPKSVSIEMLVNSTKAEKREVFFLLRENTSIKTKTILTLNPHAKLFYSD